MLSSCLRTCKEEEDTLDYHCSSSGLEAPGAILKAIVTYCWGKRRHPNWLLLASCKGCCWQLLHLPQPHLSQGLNRLGACLFDHLPNHHCSDISLDSKSNMATCSPHDLKHVG